MRVLVVADSAELRAALPGALAGHSSLELLGVVSPRALFRDVLEAKLPDAVALATGEGEEANLTTLAAVRKRHPGAAIVLLPCSEPPAGDSVASTWIRATAADLVARIERLAAVGSEEAGVAIEPAHDAIAEVRAVVIASSAGGPKALLRIVADLPADLPVPVAVVQHIPATFTRVLAERLGAVARIPVSEVVGGAPFAAGCVWIAPGGRHLELRRAKGAILMETHAGPEENSCRPAADVLFRSAAEVYGAGVLAVVLSGMGKDGLRGAEAIRARGGRILVQDEATSVVWGMPGAVFRAGLSEGALALDDIGAEIARRVLAVRPAAR